MIMILLQNIYKLVPYILFLCFGIFLYIYMCHFVKFICDIRFNMFTIVTYYHLLILGICFLEEVRELPQPRRHYPAHSVADDFLSRHAYNLIFYLFSFQYELGLINFLKAV
jgi:hypothetical protein